MNGIRYSREDVQGMLERHRQHSEREHMKFAGIGFLIGCAVIAMIWAAA